MFTGVLELMIADAHFDSFVSSTMAVGPFLTGDEMSGRVVLASSLSEF